MVPNLIKISYYGQRDHVLIYNLYGQRSPSRMFSLRVLEDNRLVNSSRVCVEAMILQSICDCFLSTVTVLNWEPFVTQWQQFENQLPFAILLENNFGIIMTWRRVIYGSDSGEVVRSHRQATCQPQTSDCSQTITDTFTLEKTTLLR